jgi:hypothetical protein
VSNRKKTFQTLGEFKMKRYEMLTVGLVVTIVFGYTIMGRYLNPSYRFVTSDYQIMVGACSSGIKQDDVCAVDSVSCPDYNVDPSCNGVDVHANGNFPNAEATGSEGGGENYGNGTFNCPTIYSYPCKKKLLSTDENGVTTFSCEPEDTPSIIINRTYQSITSSC